MFYLGRVLSIASQSCDSKMIVSKIAEIITKYQNDGLVAIFNLKGRYFSSAHERNYDFLTFPADFLIPILFSNLNYNCSIF